MAPRAPPFSRSIARLFRVSSVASRAACLAPEILTSLDLVVEQIHRLRRPTPCVSNPVTTLIIPRCTVVRIAGCSSRRSLVGGGLPVVSRVTDTEKIVSNVSNEWISRIPSFLPRLYMTASVAHRFNATYSKEISYAI